MLDPKRRAARRSGLLIAAAVTAIVGTLWSAGILDGIEYRTRDLRMRATFPACGTSGCETTR